MNGHTMRINYDPQWEAVHLVVQCHEPQDADCHATPDVCEAAEWFVDDVENQCASKEEFPMHDGMPIIVRRHGDGWVWAA